MLLAVPRAVLGRVIEERCRREWRRRASGARAWTRHVSGRRRRACLIAPAAFASRGDDAPLPCICAVQCTTRQRQLQIMGHTADRVLMGREIHTHLGHSWGRVRLRWLRTTPLAFAFRRLRPATFLWLSHRWTDAAGVTPALPRCTNDTTPTIPHQRYRTNHLHNTSISSSRGWSTKHEGGRTSHRAPTDLTSCPATVHHLSVCSVSLRHGVRPCP